MDILTIIYERLMSNAYIREQAEGRIKFYEYPPTGEVNQPYIVIDPLDSGTPSDYADDNWLTYDALMQIDIWTLNRHTTRKLANEVRNVMWHELGFYQNDDVDEWDKETGIFRRALRFRGKLYRSDING